MKQPQQQPVPKELLIAVQHHQAGRLQEAAAIYGKMQSHPDAVHLLGVIAYQSGKHSDAIDLIRKAIRINPANPTFHSNLGLAYFASKRLREAEQSYRKAIALKRDYVDAHLNLGAALHEQGKLKEAEASFRRAIELNPNLAEAYKNLGQTCCEQSRPDDAVAFFRKAIALKPDFVDAYLNLSPVLIAQGKHDEAAACCRRAIELQPQLADGHNSLGVALKDQPEAAQACFTRALELRPDFPEAINNLGGTLKGQPQQALAYFKRALALKPDYVDALNNAAKAYKELDDLDAALGACRQALALKPDFADLHNTAGMILQLRGDLAGALAAYRRAIELNPDSAEFFSNLGITLQAQGALDEAIDAYRHALRIDPDLVNAQSNLLFCCNYHPTLPPEQIFAAYRDWNARYAAPFAQHLAPFANVPDPERRLRIGYLSPDFRHHAVIHFAAPLIERHDQARFEVFCYYNNHVHDAYTDRIAAAADHFLPCQALSDDQLAQRIRDDGIDLLIDLAGHTAGNRLLVFARKPAPLQASWLGFGYTTGLSTIDYFIGDAVFTPPGSEALFSEQLYRLPHAAWVYQPPEAAPEPNAAPAVRNGYVTFACLSRSERINARMLDAWAAILRALPSARLRLDSRNFSDAALCQQLAAQFEQRGVAAGQLQLGFTSPVWQVYGECDIVLDCFPHNSGTTTYEALWMGLPVLTLADRPSVGRLGASILSCIGKPQWIAGDAEDYVRRALEMARDVSALAHERATLRQTLLASPLMDAAGFAHDMEAAYRAMWRTWCGTDAASIDRALELHRAGKFDQAEMLYWRILETQPTHVDAMHSLGLLYRQRGDLNTAIALLKQAVDILPSFAVAHNHLGLMLQAAGRPDEAAAAYRQAIQSEPAFADAHLNFGNLLQNAGRLDEAIGCYHQAIACKPDYAPAFNNLGYALQQQARLDQAISSCRRAIELQPDYAGAHNNLGLALQSRGELDEAIACYRRALEIDPNSSIAQSNLLYCHNYHPELSAEQIFDAYREWNARCAAGLAAGNEPFANPREPERRLRIGYVSPDFRRHSIVHFALPLFELRDRERFELTCYYNNDIDDEYTERFRCCSDHWIPCRGLSDEQLAQRIRDDHIDLLIDLAGHTAGNRLLAFARKPAPVQATWLGFGYTTGLSTMDYFIGDAVFTPPESETLFSEKICRLPHAAWVYHPHESAPDCIEPPALRRGYVTFGCLSRSERINARTIATWAEILKCVPNARLRLDSRNFGDPGLKHSVELRFAALGVPAQRLQIGYSSPAWDIYQDIDIALDCFPHNSGTTTCEALWMGIPVVTLADRPSVGRFGASILSCIGKPQWIASDRVAYVELAAALAHDPNTLLRERATLRATMLSSPLLDQPGFVRELESAYAGMWRTWCQQAIEGREKP